MTNCNRILFYFILFHTIIYIYLPIYTHTCIHIKYICIYMYNIYIQYIHIYIYTYVCTCMCIYTCTYTHFRILLKYSTQNFLLQIFLKSSWSFLTYMKTAGLDFWNSTVNIISDLLEMQIPSPALDPLVRTSEVDTWDLPSAPGDLRTIALR